jgi:hypothetical protein
MSSHATHLPPTSDRAAEIMSHLVQVLEDEFGKFGKLTKVWVARKPHGFAYVGTCTSPYLMLQQP